MKYGFSIQKAIVKKVFSDFIKVERCFQLRIFERNVFHILQQMPLDDALKTIISHRNIGLDPNQCTRRIAAVKIFKSILRS